MAEDTRFQADRKVVAVGERDPRDGVPTAVEGARKPGKVPVGLHPADGTPFPTHYGDVPRQKDVLAIEILVVGDQLGQPGQLLHHLDEIGVGLRPGMLVQPGRIGHVGPQLRA